MDLYVLRLLCGCIAIMLRTPYYLLEILVIQECILRSHFLKDLKHFVKPLVVRKTTGIE